jgi:hypothetical protein
MIVARRVIGRAFGAASDLRAEPVNRRRVDPPFNAPAPARSYGARSTKAATGTVAAFLIEANDLLAPPLGGVSLRLSYSCSFAYSAASTPSPYSIVSPRGSSAAAIGVESTHTLPAMRAARPRAPALT